MDSFLESLAVETHHSTSCVTSLQVFPGIAGISEEPLGARRCLSGESESLS